MNAKQFLKQGFWLDEAINTKLESLTMLRSIATKTTATLSNDCVGGTRTLNKVEANVIKIIDLENSINDDIDELVDIKKGMMKYIKKIDSYEYRVLLEKRYLQHISWEQIAVDMGYSSQHIFRLHDEALKIITFPKDESK